MKTLLALIISLLIITPVIAYSQQDTAKIKFQIKADVLLPTLGLVDGRNNYVGSMTFETCFKQRYSIQLTGLYSFISIGDRKARQYKSFQVIPEYKYFFRKRKNYVGFYTGAYLKLSYLNSIYESYADFPPYYAYIEYKQSTIAGGPIFGYQNYILKRFVFDFLIGFGYRRVIGGVNSLGKSNPDLRLAINMGYRFN